MALMDLKSNLSWYGKKPPNVDNFSNTDAPGFTPGRQELDATEFKGVQGSEYIHTGVRQLGTLKFSDWFLNDDAKGFTGNMFPLGGPKKDSQFVGISGEEFTYTGLQELGNLQNNIYESGKEFKSRFVYNDDLTISVVGNKGFNRYGTIVESPIIPVTADSFVVDDVTMSDRGLAKRKAQGGTGHPFTNEAGFGPYKWKPDVHTGWHPDNKYSDTIKKNSKAGLADTYTEDSPIDDLYNKLNLREDAHQTGYIKHPLDLRGIQREGKVDNQRWGLGDSIAGQISSTLDLPRGGILTSIERGAVDIARLAKFMVSPPGLAYMVKQLGMQLMNPNVESMDGKVQKPFHANSTKLFTPINTLLQPLAGIAGMHIRRHGVLPVDIPLSETPGTYGEVLAKRVATDTETTANRLVLLGKRYGIGYLLSGESVNSAIGKGASEFSVDRLSTSRKILSGLTGPDSVGGIGSTIIKRGDDTQLEKQLGMDQDSKAGAGGLTFSGYTAARYSYGRPYQKIKDVESVEGGSVKTVQRGNFADKTGIDGGESMYGHNNMNLAFRVGTPGFEDNTSGTFHSFNLPGASTFGIGEADNKAALKKATPAQESVMGGTMPDPGDLTVANELTKLQAYTAIKRITKERTKVGGAILDFRTIAQQEASSAPMLGYGDEAGGFNPNGDRTLTVRGYPNFHPTATDRTDSPDIYWSDPNEPGLIKFYFNPVDPTQGPGGQGNIGFRAYIDSLDDAFTPEWGNSRDQGRADQIVQYTGFSRTISVSFKVPVTSKAESTEVWRRLGALARITLPNYGGTAGFTGQFVRVTIGDLYNSVPMYINDLTYSWDSETPWEITSGEQVPFYTSVDMSLGWVGHSAPSKDQRVYNYG